MSDTEDQILTPASPEEEKDSLRGPNKYIDSPDLSDANGKESGNVCTEEEKVSKEGKQFAAMEVELDFEDFVGEAAGEKGESPMLLNSEKGPQISDEKTSQENEERESDEDGQCCTTPEKNTSSEKKDTSIEDDDGELCTDEEDLEEGELKEEADENAPKQGASRQVCRFFHRGLCFYGSCCRFLHVNFDKGNYNMFAPAIPPSHSAYSDSYGSANMMGPGLKINHRRSVPEFIPAQLPPIPPPALETAWERGLKEAKALVKKANKRKEDPDFNEKRLNLSLKVNEKNLPEFEKENDSKPKRRKDKSYSYKYQDPVENFGDDYYDAPPSYSKEPYENFEVRYTHMRGGEDRRERSRGRRPSIERGSRFQRSNRRGWNDVRMEEIQSRSRSDEYFDPWRRSKSPKGHRTALSRSGSYSSVSSYSYSDRSRSSCSYSRSSSRSSNGSSRSPSVQQQKRKQSPPAETIVSPNRFAPLKKHPVARERTSSSRSRSVSRTPSRSRSYSRSISMSSVSSASSSVSHSSSGSGSHKHRNAHGSNQRKSDDKSLMDKSDSITSSDYIEVHTAPKFDKTKDVSHIGAFNDEVDPLEEKFQSPIMDMNPFPGLQHLIPDFPEKSKEPVKGLHKQQIKLTLLNKNPSSKLINMPKKDLELHKKPDDSSKSNLFHLGSKRPLSPPTSPMPPPRTTPAVIPKKSASSRRDELLKQLKAVEDAIARKRAKF